MSKKPNILFLFSDQHSARALGCYGNKEIYTPNLDRLASEGVKCTNAYTQNPICTPSRMCFMSGQYAHNFGYYGLMGPNPVNLPHIFKHLRQFGYTTGMAGKIHTPSRWLSDDCDYVADGFGFETPVKRWGSNLEEGLQGLKYNDYALYLQEKGLLEKLDIKVVPEWFKKHGHTKGQGVDATYSELPEEHSIEAWTARCTNHFIEKSHSEGNPFCFWMTVPRPHQTYLPAKKFWDLYSDKKLTLPPNAENELHDRHISAKKTQDGFQKSDEWMIFEPKDWESARERVLRGYYACVSQVDDAVGQVLDKLDKLGIRDNTIIVYSSDHGEFAGEHGMIEKAPGISFRCVTRIPYIWSWPGHLPQNVVRQELIESVDFLPTICSLAGVETPNWVDGSDASKLLIGGGDIHEIAVTENPYTKTVHTKEFKFTQFLPEMTGGEDFGELYDMQVDPWELKNLYFDPQYKEVVQDLRYKLYCWLVRTARNVTIYPWVPSLDGKPGFTWDFAEDRGLVNIDKKVGFDLAKKMIEGGNLNYL